MHLLPSRQLRLNTAWTKIERNKHWLWILLLCTVPCMMGTSYCSVLHAVALYAVVTLFCVTLWIECKAHCAISVLSVHYCVLCAVYCQACCVSMLCSQQCTVCCVFTVRSTLPVVHCVCVRFPAPLMPVNRELVGRGQFLKYRHRPMLWTPPAGGSWIP